MTPTLDKEVDGVFRGALGELRNLGAEVIDPVAVAELDALRRTQGGGCNQFKFDLNRFLGALGDKAPMHSLEEIIKSRRFHPSIQARLESSQSSEDVPGETAGCKARDAFRENLRAAVLALMTQRLDAPDLSDLEQPAAPHRRLNTPGGDNSQFFRRAPGSLRLPCRWDSRAAIPSPPASNSSDGRGARRRSSAWRTRTSRPRIIDGHRCCDRLAFT
jgi:hypothetical protein